MAEPYVPPEDPEERLIEIALDGSTSRARSILWFCGIVYVLLGIVSGPLSALPVSRSPDASEAMRIGVLVGATLGSCVTGIGFGSLNLAAASGLARGAKWGWYLSVILGALLLPGCCLPLGAAVLYSLLNEKTRRLFLG